ncbi:gp25 [Alphaproteobacteria phage PhiJL001]|uniref:Gp25 n=1 Tax=Alphaproteobacteria phage PhiJL001 TaxID=2681607 RepID=Q5DN80_9CAUD|nr:gp25 [Alphaproteobacteria phage PhiJL001]AAT69501.1 gp25 [Alphaproteobacteria phage PhiJL001]
MAPTTTRSERLKALREGGWVDRCHTLLKTRRYDVAQHSWNMLNLALVLFPQHCHPDLIKAIQWHDVPERWVGDSPWPAKHPLSGSELAILLGSMEHRIEAALYISPNLEPIELDVLKICDMLEFALWCQEEWLLGNTHIEHHFRTAMDVCRTMKLWPEISDVIEELLKEPISEARPWTQKECIGPGGRVDEEEEFPF